MGWPHQSYCKRGYPVDHMQCIRSKDMSVDNLIWNQYHITYGTIVCVSAFQYRLYKLEILQNKSFRNRCSAGYDALITPRFKQLGITKLMDIYNIQLCKLMCSYTTGTLITPLQTLFTNNYLVRSHQTRHSREQHIIVRKRAVPREALFTNAQRLG